MEGNMQRVGALTAVPQVLFSLGADPTAMVMCRGINLSVLRNAENMVPTLATGQLLEACANATGCRHFGLMVGKSGSLATLGVLGRLMQNARTVGEAFEDLMENQHRDVQGALSYLRVLNDSAVVGYTIYQKGIQASSQIYDVALSHLLNIFIELANSKPNEVAIPCAKPVNLTPYRNHFRTLLRFDSDRAAIMFSPELLNLPVRGASPMLRKVLLASIADHGMTLPRSLSDQVSRVLRTQMSSQSAALDNVAGLLAIHPRKLNRRLENEGTSFRTLRNETRLEHACQLLKDTDLSLTQISLALDYADLSVFSHAFRRMSGTTPSLWRSSPP